MCWPATVVQDRDDLLALWIPEGTKYKNWRMLPAADPSAPPERTLVDEHWRRDTLRLMFPGRRHSIWLSWESARDGHGFHGYYGNLEEDFRRTPLGVDTNDHCLDIVVSPSMEWEWKDSEELDRRCETGMYTTRFAQDVRAEAARVIEVLEARDHPFDGSWEGWRPDAAWGTPLIPDGWDTLPPALWPQRREAYADAPR